LLILVLGDQGKAQHVALSKKAKVNENVPTFVCLDMQNSSDLPKGTPRFQEYTCDGDIATNENAAASNDDGEKDEDEYNDVNNVVINLTASVFLKHWQSSLLPHYSHHYIHLHL